MVVFGSEVGLLISGLSSLKEQPTRHCGYSQRWRGHSVMSRFPLTQIWVKLGGKHSSLRVTEEDFTISSILFIPDGMHTVIVFSVFNTELRTEALTTTVNLIRAWASRGREIFVSTDLKLSRQGNIPSSKL